MTIATLNIDWGRRHLNEIQAALNARDFDLLILTESIPLDLPSYEFIYASTSLPQEQDYEGMNYATFTKGANRVAIYSKYPSKRQYQVSDEYTSCCHEFETSVGSLTIYATIIGTWFRKRGYAKKELDNCIKDCEEIAKQTDTLCLMGDLNTSFMPEEKQWQINEDTTNLLRALCATCNFQLSTATLANNIDHIFLPQHLNPAFSIIPKVFVEKGNAQRSPGCVRGNKALTNLPPLLVFPISHKPSSPPKLLLLVSKVL